MLNFFKKKEIDCQDMKSLTQAFAKQRAKQIVSKTVSYDLVLILKEGSKYEGKVQVTFEVTKLYKNNIYIDYSGDKIVGLKINRHPIKIVEWNGKFLKLKYNYLIDNGVNMVEIQFKNKYSNNGCGLHSYIDPKDQNQYLYSQCEAYYCNMIFPNFDQPDIKARLLLTVIIPKHWKFIANESAKSSVETNEFKKIEFNPTAYISTYLYAFIAGPYYQIDFDFEDNNMNHLNCDIPMSLYCTQTRKQSLQKQKDFIFDVTCNGINFFEKFFQYKYPFTKYDQIFCPEFNSGAMENVGAVTFNDKFLFQEEVDIQKLSSFANTIIHELAHMWFGNLVTMKWWNDLWLNESFADFISHFCLSKISINKFESIRENIWLQFNFRKSWGYREDQLPTTHPIAGKVPNTDVARTIFDGITYSKGASTIKQLLFVIGEEIFSQSLATYFGKNAFSNATLEDFMQSLSMTYLKVKKMDFDFRSWQKMHIQAAGLNVVEPYFDPETSQTTLTIVQSCALQSHLSLRRHKMKICFFDDNATMHDQTIYVLPQIDTIIKYKYPFRIRAVLLNFEDHAFVKVALDKESLSFFKKNLHYIHDDLTRTLIWRSIFEMVRDARISSDEYLEIFKKIIVNERTDSIVINQFMYMKAVLFNYTPPQYLVKYSEDMFNFIQQYMRENLYSKNKIIALRQIITSFVKAKDSIDLIESSYLQQIKQLKSPKGLNVLAKVGLRTSNVVSLIHSSNFHSREQKRKFYENCLFSNNNLFNQTISQRCLIQDYTLQECQYLWETFIQHPQLKSLKVQEVAMSAFNLQNQYPKFTDEWFDSIEKVFQKQTKEYASLFFDQLFPRDENISFICDRLRFLLKKVEKNQKQTKQQSEYGFLLIKKLKVAIDDIERKIKAHKKFIQDEQNKMKPSL
ncbi:hypothetical protein ABPG72_004204 [Tetrahymena utriculariae]